MKKYLEIFTKYWRRLIKFSKAFGVFLLYLIIIPGFTYAILLSKGLKNYSNREADIRLLLTQVILFVIILIIYRKDMIKDAKNFKKDYRGKLKIAFKYWLVGLSLMIIFNFIINIILFSGSMATNEEINRSYLTQYPIYAIGSLIFLGPIIEEMVFRLGFKNAFKSKKTFLIFTTIMFALVHLLASIENLNGNYEQLLYILPYGALGYGFAKAYLESDNIWSSIIVHQIQNLLSITIILLSL